MPSGVFGWQGWLLEVLSWQGGCLATKVGGALK